MNTFWEARNVFVTGAGGFVGSWLAHALVERRAQVTVILRDEPARSNFHLLGLETQVNVVRGSITDQALVERVINDYEIDTCFHLAAQAIVGAANRSPVATFESNIKGSWSVLEACRLSKTIQGVIVASSDKAYGSQPSLPYTEDMPLLGLNPYDASKVCTDVLARSCHQAFGLPVVVARCGNIYGGGDLNFSRLVPGTIRSALRGERPIIRSDGTPVRDYLYVDDAVRAYLSLREHLQKPDVLGKAFNFGADRPVSVLELTQQILEACSVPDLEPDIRGAGSPAGEIDRQYMNSERARAVLGWSAQYPLPGGLWRSVSWYGSFLGIVQRSSGSRRAVAA